MPLNPINDTHPTAIKTFQYDEDAAFDFMCMLKYSARKFNASGKVNPKGGLVDLVFQKNTLYPTGYITGLQFHDFRPGDPTVYPPMRPKVWDGNNWISVGEYVCDRCQSWAASSPAISDNIAGFLPEIQAESQHFGKYPHVEHRSYDWG